MKSILIICGIVLLIGISNMPIGYYTFLRIIVTIGAIAVALSGGVNFWSVVFGIIAIVFNPLIPVYLHDKSLWVLIDIIAGIIFLVRAFTLKQQANER